MFSIHNGAAAAGFLSIGNNVQTDGGLTGRFRPEDFHDSAPGQTADTQRQVQRQCAGADNIFGIVSRGIPQPHNGAFAELFFNLRDSYFQILIAFGIARNGRNGIAFDCHNYKFLNC